MTKRRKPLTATQFNAMTDAQKEAIWQDLERITPLDAGQPLTASQRALHRRGKRRVGRPKVGEGAEKVRISLERHLLRQTDALAEKRDLTRSQLIATALRRLIAAA